MSLIGVLSIVIFLVLLIFWRRFWTPDMMLSEPNFKSREGAVSSVATQFIVRNHATLDRMLLYKIMQNTLKKQN